MKLTKKKSLSLRCLLLLLFFLGNHIRTYSQSKVLEDLLDSEDLKTITFYAYAPQDKYTERYLNPPIAHLNHPNQLLFLEFDDLKARFASYKTKIIHCNPDWTPSNLLDLEFLTDINEFYINDYQVSQNTKTPYYHYRHIVAKPKISGNFILQLFENDHLVLQRRFWIYENAIDINASVQAAQDPEFWKTSQQVNLQLNLGNYRVAVPGRELRVVLRQNQNYWMPIDNSDLSMSGVNTYTLQHFQPKYLFPARNEYRYLDISSTFRKGQNVKDIILGTPDEIITYPQINRGRLNFADSYDNNGGYIISNGTNEDPDISADYANVIFQLPALALPNYSKAVLLGKFSDWQPLPFEYNPETNLQQCAVFLKNGVYDFMIGMDNEKTIDLNYYEGDFYQTRNNYEVFVYHTTPAQRYSRLIGYQYIKMQ